MFVCDCECEEGETERMAWEPAARLSPRVLSYTMLFSCFWWAVQCAQSRRAAGEPGAAVWMHSFEECDVCLWKGALWACLAKCVLNHGPHQRHANLPVKVEQHQRPAVNKSCPIKHEHHQRLAAHASYFQSTVVVVAFVDVVMQSLSSPSGLYGEILK